MSFKYLRHTLLICLLLHVCLEGQEHTCSAQKPGTPVLLIQVCQESASAALGNM